MRARERQSGGRPAGRLSQDAWRGPGSPASWASPAVSPWPCREGGERPPFPVSAIMTRQGGDRHGLLERLGAASRARPFGVTPETFEASSAENVVTRRVTDSYGGRGRARLICILRIVGRRPVRFRCRSRGTPDRRGVRKASGCNLHTGNPSTRLFVLTCPWFSILSVSSGAFG